MTLLIAAWVTYVVARGYMQGAGGGHSDVLTLFLVGLWPLTLTVVFAVSWAVVAFVRYLLLRPIAEALADLFPRVWTSSVIAAGCLFMLVCWLCLRPQLALPDGGGVAAQWVMLLLPAVLVLAVLEHRIARMELLAEMDDSADLEVRDSRLLL